MIDADSVIASVARAFPAEPVPPKAELLKTHCCECIETSEAFGYKPWPAISLDDLLAGRETALLTATAWRYYLPAVISWCVRAPETVDVIMDNLVFQLEPPKDRDGAWFEERAHGFSGPQREAIVSYLTWYQEREVQEYREMGLEPPGGVVRALKYWARDDAECCPDPGV